MKLSAVIITKNEQDWIENCLKSVNFADQIIVVDCGSTDKTLEICRKYKAEIFSHEWEGFSAQKNFALTKAGGDWVLFIDSDERVSKELKREIADMLQNPKNDAYAIPRQNILLGEFVKHGGWEPDYVTRLARKDRISGWEGDLHEELKVNGTVTKLKNPFYHLSHRGVTWMLEKSIKYTQAEADLRYKANHPPVVWWRFLRVMAGEFIDRLIVKSGWRDGTVGWIEAISQSYNIFLIYARLWEKQKGKPMEQIYKDLDKEMAANGF